MNYIPRELTIRFVLAILGFVLGWCASSLLVRKFLRTASIPEAICFGFVGWNATIVAWAVMLVTIGLFHPVGFVLLPLVTVIGVVVYTVRHDTYGAILPDIRRAGGDRTMLGIATAAAIFFLYIAHFNLLFPPDTWDTWQYHRPMTAMLVQEGRLWNIPSTYWAALYYPRNGQIVSAWMLAAARWDSPLRLLPVFNLGVLLLAVYTMLRSWKTTRGEAAILALTPLAAPGFLGAVMRDVGDIDINVAAACATALAGILRLPHDRKNLWARVVLVAVTLAFILGLKGTGGIYTIVLGLLLLGFLIAQRTGYRLIGSMMGVGVVATLLLSSYWLIANYATRGNPLFPMEVRIGSITIFEGHDFFDRPEAITGQPKALDGKDFWHKFLRSSKQLETDKYYWGDHLGGWGWHFRRVGMYLWFVALGMALFQRDWRLLATLMALSILFVVTPASWWVRFSFLLLAAAPLTLLPVLQLARRTPALRAIFVGLYCAPAIYGAVNALDQMEFTRRPWEIEKRLKTDDRHYAIPQDVFRHLRDWAPDRDMYRWIAWNMEPDSTLVHDMWGGDNFEGLFYRPDYRNHVYPIRFPEESPQGYDYLVLSLNDKVHRDIFESRRTMWTILYENDGYAVIDPASIR